MKLDSAITADLRVNEVIRAHPDTVGIFNELGVDACCGGNKTLAEAATENGLDLEAVLEKLESRRTPDAV